MIRSDRNGNWDIYMMNPDGSGRVCLTNHDADNISICWWGGDGLSFLKTLL